MAIAVLAALVWLASLTASGSNGVAAGQDPDPQPADETAELRALVKDLAARVERLQARVATLEAGMRDLQAKLAAGAAGNGNGNGETVPAPPGSLTFGVAGQVTYLCAPGPVKQGQLIAELDRANRLQRLATANDTIQGIKAGLPSLRRWAIEAQAAQMAARAAADAANAEMARLQPEVAAGRQPQSALQAARARYAQAMNDANRHDVARRMHEQRAREQEAELARLEALAAEHRELLPRYRILAPADGEVTAVHVEVGQNVASGDPILDFRASK